MNFNSRIEKSINGRRVEAGATWNQPLDWPHLQLVATCVRAEPELFRAEVRLGSHVLVTTEPVGDLHLAQKTAENAFIAKVAGLFDE